MQGLLLSNRTRLLLEAYLAKPGAPLLLTGPQGAGKKAIAEAFISKLIDDDQSGSRTVSVERQDKKQDISIDQIRQVTKFLRLRTTGPGEIRRAVLIIDSQLMNEEAQNALLKALEEPPDDTIFILTALSGKSVLPTIASRCEKIDILPVSLAASKRFFEHATSRDIESAWRLSGGNVGLMSSLLGDKQHELKQSVNEVKDFLSLPRYERIIFLEKKVKDKAQLGLFLAALFLSLTALHRRSIERYNLTQSKKLLAARQLTKNLTDILQANVAIKIIIDKLVLNLEL